MSTNIRESYQIVNGFLTVWTRYGCIKMTGSAAWQKRLVSQRFVCVCQKGALCVAKRSNWLLHCPSLQLDSPYLLSAAKLISKSKYQTLAQLHLLVPKNRSALLQKFSGDGV